MTAALPENGAPLAGRRIAVPETRELDVLAGLFTRRGAEVFRCPLVGIVDAPEAAPVVAWLQTFAAEPPGFLILMTGEGVRRLEGFIAREGLDRDAFIAALKATTIVARGPKPARALRALGLGVDHAPEIATTDGVIDLLDGLELAGQRVSVQLYGDDPNEKLLQYLGRRGAQTDTVAPYRYVDEVADARIAELLDQLQAKSLDALVFTSKSQVERLFRVADALGRRAALDTGLAATCVAAIGPVVAEKLAEYGCGTDIAPGERYFMKPLVAEISRWFANRP